MRVFVQDRCGCVRAGVVASGLGSSIEVAHNGQRAACALGFDEAATKQSLMCGFLSGRLGTESPVALRLRGSKAPQAERLRLQSALGAEPNLRRPNVLCDRAVCVELFRGTRALVALRGIEPLFKP